ncbi:MAG: asparaginase, partial [Bacteroidales bacterium]|nr:asparaginase [Bacteroidales bacterium]
MKILIIYTGGTIGMKQDTETSALIPFDFSHIQNEMPELKRFGYVIDTCSFDK